MGHDSELFDGIVGRRNDSAACVTTHEEIVSVLALQVAMRKSMTAQNVFTLYTSHPWHSRVREQRLCTFEVKKLHRETVMIES